MSKYFEKYFEKEIKDRLANLFRDFVDEEDMQSLVDDFGIDPSNAVEGLFKDLVNNEYDELHEGRYEELKDEEDDITHSVLERIGNKILDKILKWDYNQICNLVGKTYCTKLEKQMQDLGNEEEESSESSETSSPSWWDDMCDVEPEAIDRWVERMKGLEKDFPELKWNVPGPLKTGGCFDYMGADIGPYSIYINVRGFGRISPGEDNAAPGEDYIPLHDIKSAADVDNAIDMFLAKIDLK